MIKSKTYYGAEGLNYIEASELVYTTVYLVKRSGIQHDRYISGDSNRTHIYSRPLGRIIFPNTFNSGGENVFVIYKDPSSSDDPIPGVCVPVSNAGLSPKSGQVDIPYLHSIPLSGTPPYTLSNIDKPDWAAVAPFATYFVRITGTPTAAGNFAVSFDITNGCGFDSYEGNIYVRENTDNFFVERAYYYTTIHSINGIDYTITNGFVPNTGFQNASGYHEAYTGVISVRVIGITFPLTLRLLKNEVEVSTVAVPSNGTYPFSAQSFTVDDQIKIILN